MARFVIRRLIGMVPVLFAISVLTFLIFNVIPNGDPALRMAGRHPTEGQLEHIRKEWGFDDPIFVQYLKTMEKVFTGDLLSYCTQLDVDQEINNGLPRTLSLAIGAAIMWMFVAIASGSTRGQGREVRRPVPHRSRPDRHLDARLLDRGADELLPGLQAGDLPQRRLCPAHRGSTRLGVSPDHALDRAVDPVHRHLLARSRSNVLDTINEDYVRTARAKGFAERHIMVRHVLRNSMIPIITLWGLDFGAVLGGGAILTETVFDLQGVGQYAADSIGQLDVPPVLAVTMFGAFFIVVMNALVDIIYAYLDPRIRLT